MFSQENTKRMNIQAKKYSQEIKCPDAFPYASSVHKNQVCYNNQLLTNSGFGGCGTWCTLDLNYNNGGHICGTHSTLCSPVITLTHTWQTTPGTMVNLARQGTAFASGSLVG